MGNFAKDSVTNRNSTRHVRVFGGAIALLVALNRILPALSRAATTLKENLRLRPATPVNCLHQPTGIYHPLETQPRKGKVSLIYWTSTRAFTGLCNRPRKKSSSCKTLRSRGISSMLRSLLPV
jgi:hypothetical protein